MVGDEALRAAMRSAIAEVARQHLPDATGAWAAGGLTCLTFDWVDIGRCSGEQRQSSTGRDPRVAVRSLSRALAGGSAAGARRPPGAIAVPGFPACLTTTPRASRDPVDFADLPLWEQRLRARRVGLPDWAEDAPDRCAVVATTADGVIETHSWTPGRRAGPADPPLRRHDRLRPSTRRASGSGGSTTRTATSTASGGGSRSAPRPGEDVVDATGLPAAYSRRAGDRAGRARRGRLQRRRLRHPDPRRRLQRHRGATGRGCSTSTGRARTSAGCPATRRSSRSATASTATPGTRPCAWSGSTDGSTVGELLGRRGQGRAAGGLLAGRRATSGCWSSTSGTARPGC